MRLTLISLLFFIISCTPPVVFDQPYPPDAADLELIPLAFQGEYICESDSALVIISDKNITIHRTNYFQVPLSQIEQRNDCSIADDKMYVTGRHECIALDMVNDSTVRGIFEEHDTMFVMQPGSIARLYKGHLMINQEYRNNEWAVNVLSPQPQSDLILKAITQRSNINDIKKITPTKDITTSKDKKPRYIVKPTLKEFDELFNDKKIFIECEYLTRVKLQNPFLN